MPGIGLLIKAATLILILSPMLVGFTFEYGPAGAANKLNQTLGGQAGLFNTNVYNPLNKTINQGLNASSNEQQSSISIGFVLAFILPGFVSIVKAAVSMPAMIAIYSNAFVGALPGSGVPFGLYVGYLIDDLILFTLVWGLSLWMKMPGW